MENRTIQDTIDAIVDWGSSRGILENSTASKQFLKTIEEVGELSIALQKDDIEQVKDAVGDVAVTLILLAELKGLHFADCVSHAYDVISKRKGKMQNGVFVKD